MENWDLKEGKNLICFFWDHNMAGLRNMAGLYPVILFYRQLNFRCIHCHKADSINILDYLDYYM